MLAATFPDVASLAERLIEAPSVTPAAGLVFDTLEAMLAPLGFAVTRFHAGEPPDGPVENLFAVRHGPPGCRHFAGGHGSWIKLRRGHHRGNEVTVGHFKTRF